MGKPDIYPTGVTLYDPDKAWNGYTVFPTDLGATVIDMNGQVVKIWKGIKSSPVKLLPGGFILGGIGSDQGKPGEDSILDMVQADWDGKVVWHYFRNQEIDLPDGTRRFAALQHHDFQRQGSPTGYYAPDLEPWTDRGNTLLLTHERCRAPHISDKELRDERILEVNWQGEIVWEWKSREHFHEMGFDETIKAAIAANPAGGDWLHINAVSVLGPNRWYDQGDRRFHPDNLICSSRQCNMVFIIEKATGRLVWKIGPKYLGEPGFKALGQIIGQHHAHMIPRGLPGEGNILLFDNGSFGGYGEPTGSSPDGVNTERRHYSRVLEFDPLTLELKWEYVGDRLPNGRVMVMGAQRMFSPFISSVQRLPNGNTLIDEGADGLFLEVTPEGKKVWEFVNPIPNKKAPDSIRYSVYRAYRVPYEWIPQLSKPEEIPVTPPDIETYRVPGSLPFGDPETVNTTVLLETKE